MNLNHQFFKKMQDNMEKKILPVSTKLAEEPHLAAIRDGMMILIPLTIIGGISVLVAYPPVPAGMFPGNIVNDFLIGWQMWAETYANILMVPYYLSIGCISIYVAAGVSYYLAKHYKLSTIYNVISAVFIVLLISHAVDVANANFDITNLGPQGMFASMLSAILCVEINRFFQSRGSIFKVSEVVPDNVRTPFITLASLAFDLILFSVLDGLMVHYTGYGLISVIYVLIRPLLTISNTLPSILVLMMISSLFWFFGIHGDSLISPILIPITTANLAANTAAYQAGKPLPYIMVGNLAVYGGWITYHAFVASMFLFCKSEKLRLLPRVSAIPSLFNINEPNVFGMPTVLNIFTFIPNIICLVINLSTYYFLALAGWIGKPFLNMPFTVPVAIQAFLSSADYRNALLVIILFFVDLMICMPFIKAYDRQLIDEENQ